MGVLTLLFVIAAIGVFAYLIRRYVPMDEPMKKVVVVAAVVISVLLIAYAIGLLPMGDIRVPRVR